MFGERENLGNTRRGRGAAPKSSNVKRSGEADMPNRAFALAQSRTLCGNPGMDTLKLGGHILVAFRGAPWERRCLDSACRRVFHPRHAFPVRELDALRLHADTKKAGRGGNAPSC
jgi:hypothetical protein